MPRPYPTEFRASASALVRAGKPQKQTARDLGIHPVTLPKWINRMTCTVANGPGFRQANPRSCGPFGGASASWKPRATVRQAATFQG